MDNQVPGKFLPLNEYVPARCFKIDNQHFWDEVQRTCEVMKRNDGNNYCEKFKKKQYKELELTNEWVKEIDCPDDSWYYGGTRIRGTWKWNEGGDDTNWIYDYRCNKNRGYICEAAPESSTDIGPTSSSITDTPLITETLMDPCSLCGLNSSFVALIGLVIFLLVIILGLGVYIFLLKRQSKACSTEMKEVKEEHNIQGNMRNRHDSENSLYGKY
ncbi:unnamed protein product [Meganyctiphanes norvegica]|uniref:C-type lectin domain-containing protein n=1 Tax=Meganyctiphanes norvegica TaxID=48144 RepID=A0AAV2R501_MEGNR